LVTTLASGIAQTRSRIGLRRASKSSERLVVSASFPESVNRFSLLTSACEEAFPMLRDHARTIWQSAVDAADPRQLVRDALKDPALPLQQALAGARRILVAGAGKAGAAMCLGVEEALDEAALGKLEGIVNVPDFSEPPALRR